MATSEEPSGQNKSSGGHRRSNSYDRALSDDPPPVNQTTMKNPTPEPAKQSTNPEQSHEDRYIVKWIEFNHERLPILLQNINGPCPLLAIANILLLTKRILINPNAPVISTERIIASIAEYMLRIDPQKLNSIDRANYERNLEDALAVLPKLTTGIDVNLKFNGVDQFEYTRECVIFDLLGIQLYHGWVIDPQDTELKKIVNSNASSYNQLVEKMIHYRQSTDENLSRESLLIEQFLEENQSQLTHYGILQLNVTMRENQFAILFRNNHFNAIWKHNKQLLLLVSDQGYVNHPSIVFETLTDTDNNSSFTNGYGQIWGKSAPVDTARDRDLAIAIHNAECRQYHAVEQQRQQQQARHPQGYYYEQNPRKSKKKHRKPSYDDDNSNCTLS